MPSSKNAPKSRPTPVGSTVGRRGWPEGDAYSGGVHPEKLMMEASEETRKAHIKAGTSLGNQRVNSPNVGNWDPDIRLLQSSDKWISAYGLKKLKLELQQILPTIGFKHSDDFVQALKKPISARYSKGLFARFPYKDGTVYNLVATRDKLKNIEKQLLTAISLYKKRMEWLTSESRRIFGVIEEKCISIVLDIQATSENQFDMYIQSLIQAIKEQVIFITKFNLIRVAIDADCWQDSVTCVTLESVDSALDWLLEQEMRTETSATSTTEAVIKAMSDNDVEAVYLFTEGNASCSSKELLKRKLRECGKQLNIVSFNCTDPSTAAFLQELSKIGGGRFHTFSMFESIEGTQYEKALTAQDGSEDTEYSSHRVQKKNHSARIGSGVREDVMKIWEELDSARNTLSEIQALLVEFENPQKAKQGTKFDEEQSSVILQIMEFPRHSPLRYTFTKCQLKEDDDYFTPNKAIAKAEKPKKEVIQREEKGELYMSSKQWLTRHGLKAKRLSFYDFLQTLAFKHCDGVVDIKHAPKGDVGDAVVKQKLVNARYCDRFAHVKWKDGELMHVHVNGPMHRSYEERILVAVESYRKRMEWLQQGSRELFGTIIEDQVVILIDTSSSIASRLFLIKDKLYRLMQEQLRHKRKFNIIKFDSRVQPWRDHLVDCNDHNLENAWQWVKSLTTGGSTNTLGALKRALGDSQVHAVYLLTDGRPDQPPATVLAQSALINTVPIHTISFNCADSEANEFLSQLAADTGGRFHYFSEDGYDSKGPRPFESEDLRLLREEIEKGLADLQKVNNLRDECTRLDWYGKEKEKCSRNHGTHSPQERPRSALARTHESRTTMPTSSGIHNRPASALVRSHSATSPSKSRTSSHSSHAGSVTQNELTPTPPVATNRATQLRLNAARRAESDDEWVLRETREYLERSRYNSSKGKATQKETKKRRKPRSRSPESTMRRWLKKNNLVAKKLTILDALAPTMIPHTTKYVPILDKHVLSKVFDQHIGCCSAADEGLLISAEEVLPLAHTSGSDRSAVQIINPQAANLSSYEDKLASMIELYKRKLDEFVFPNLSTSERLKYSGGEIPSFLENKESMLNDLDQNGWPISKTIIEQFENEINQAEVYLSQSEELRETSDKLSKEALEKQKQIEEKTNMQTIKVTKVPSEASIPVTAAASSSTRHLKNQRVIARNALDGFYYPGIVGKCLNSRYLEVDFDNGDRQITSARYILPIGGARPCPTLKAGDYVFVRSKSFVDWNFEYNYVPGIVQVTPLRHRSASKCYTVIQHNGTKITVLRNDMVKISRSRFIFACRFIRDVEHAAQKDTEPTVIYPSPERPQEEEEVPSRASSRASSHRSSRSSRSASSADSSLSGSMKSLEKEWNQSPTKSPSPKVKSPGSSRSNSSNGSSNSSGKSSKSNTPVMTPEGTPHGTPRSATPVNESPQDQVALEVEENIRTMLEDFKKTMEEKYLKQINDLDQERQRLETLHDNFLKQQEDQRMNQNSIEEQQKKLQEKHQDLLQRQLDQQHEDQKRLIEDQNKLHQQQEELLRRQKNQHDQLLQSQLNQSRSLNLQYLQLVNRKPTSVKDQQMETERNGKDQETETESNNEDKHTETDRSESRESQTSPMPSRKNSVEAEDGHEERGELNDSNKIEEEKDEKPEEVSSELTMFIGDESEAVLITKGDHGLLVSRKPPEEDPAVVAQDLPRPVNVGEEVLARWSDDGWYYRGTIKEDYGDLSYAVEDSVGNIENIVREDIICDEDDADNVINTGDTVVALHPGYPYSYAPGVVLLKLKEPSLKIRFYDGQEDVVSREEMYLLSPDKFERASSYIIACEDGLVGQAVVARNDGDGKFHLGGVRERVSGPRNYLVEWADQKLHIQNYAYIFGAHTKKRQLAVGDCVLAISDAAEYTYLPGKITAENDQTVTVKFCDNKSLSDVDPLQAFWISNDYYERVAAYFLQQNVGKEPEKEIEEETPEGD